MAECCIGLGGNVGDTAKYFSDVLTCLTDAGVSVDRVSSNIVTPAMGASAGADFLNAAAVLTTALSPEELLALLHEIETRLGRHRTVHWGPRTVDLDLLLYGDDQSDSQSLVLPHPGLWYRRFVLQPLSEIAGDWLHPVLDETIDELYARLIERPMVVEIVNGSDLQFSLEHIVGELRREPGMGCVQLHVTAGDEPAPKENFARIEFVRPGTRSGDRSQPANSLNRTLTIVLDLSLEFDEQLMLVLHDFFAAALGT